MANHKSKTKIRWSLRDVLRGKSSTLLVAGTALALAATVIVDLVYTGDPQKPVTPLDILSGLLSLKADVVAESIIVWFAFFVPALLVLWIPLAALTAAVLNMRDRNLPRNQTNLLLHEIESSRAWTWPWSIMVGCMDFTAMSFLYELASQAVCDWLQVKLPSALAVLITVIFLVIAERRVNSVSTKSSITLAGNRGAIEALFGGLFDPYIPEKNRNELGYAKTATVIQLGVVRTPRLASLVVSGIDLRDRVKHFSAFLNSTIHGLLTAITFGIAARTCNEVGLVGGAFARDEGNAVAADLLHPETAKPRFVFEICAAAICAIYTCSVYVGYIQSGTLVLIPFL